MNALLRIGLAVGVLVSMVAQVHAQTGIGDRPVGPLRPGPQIEPVVPIVPGPRIETVRVRALSHSRLNANADQGPPAPRQAATLFLEIANVRDAESVHITDVDSSCGWVNQPNIRYGTLTPDAQGKVRQTRIGVFTDTASNCMVRATIVVQRRQTSSPNPPLELTSPSFTLMGTRTVTLSTHAQIDALFGFGLQYQFGVCEGFSDFGAGRFPVGKVADSRNDFTIAIRSGPIGTDCRWHSKMVQLPPGVKPLPGWDITAAASDENRPANLPSDIVALATCAITPAGIHYGGSAGPASSSFHFSRGTAWLPMGPFNSGENPFMEGFPPITTRDGVTLIPAEQSAPRTYLAVIPTLRVELACGRTLVNDHWGLVTIKSVRFIVPDNVTFP